MSNIQNLKEGDIVYSLHVHPDVHYKVHALYGDHCDVALMVSGPNNGHIYENVPYDCLERVNER